MSREEEAIPEEIVAILDFLRPRCEVSPPLRDRVLRFLAEHAEQKKQAEQRKAQLRRALARARAQANRPRALRHRPSTRRARPQREPQAQGWSLPLWCWRLAGRLLAGAALSMSVVSLFAVAREMHEAAAWLVIGGMLANRASRWIATDRRSGRQPHIVRFHGWSTFLLFVVAQAVLSWVLLRRVPGRHDLWEYLVPIVPSLLVLLPDACRPRGAVGRWPEQI